LRLRSLRALSQLSDLTPVQVSFALMY
jgi:hypothetical protein